MTVAAIIMKKDYAVVDTLSNSQALALLAQVSEQLQNAKVWFRNAFIVVVVLYAAGMLFGESDLQQVSIIEQIFSGIIAGLFVAFFFWSYYWYQQTGWSGLNVVLLFSVMTLGGVRRWQKHRAFKEHLLKRFSDLSPDQFQTLKEELVSESNGAIQVNEPVPANAVAQAPVDVPETSVADVQTPATQPKISTTDDADEQFSQAMVLLADRSSHDNIAEAERILVDITQQDPSHSSALILLGRVYSLKGNSEDAILLYEEAAIEGGDTEALIALEKRLLNIETNLNKGLNQEQLMKVYQYLGRQIKNKTANAKTFYLFGLVAEMQGKPDTAERYYTQALKRGYLYATSERSDSPVPLM